MTATIAKVLNTDAMAYIFPGDSPMTYDWEASNETYCEDSKQIAKSQMTDNRENYKPGDGGRRARDQNFIYLALTTITVIQLCQGTHLDHPHQTLSLKTLV